jgi:UDP-N-acetylglucosamine 2-epimerase (non-hydrolysing)
MALEHVMSVVGARPNFMKTAPVIAELARRPGGPRHTLVHTGQHYDDAMSAIFLEQLGVGAPDHLLGVGSGSHATQTARVMERLEPVLQADPPDVLLVPGDINSTLAAALVAGKLGVPVAHIEAGLRSGDRGMPEEINRILTDQLSNLLFTHSPEARENLRREGVEDRRIQAVGNTMIDTLVAMRPRFPEPEAPDGPYLVVTLHRPALVDGGRLAAAVRALDDISEELPVLFPVHPRTAASMARQNLRFASPRVHTREPLGYLEFLSLVERAAGVLTDSGGIQEETTFLGVPCFTLRSTTERPITCTMGTNVLLGLAPERIREVPALLRAAAGRGHAVPPGWDGHAAERLVDVLQAGIPPWPQPDA